MNRSPIDRTTHSERWWQRPQATVAALVLILLLAAYFRTTNLFDWDGGFGFHPDELFYGYNVAGAVRTPPSLGDFFDSAVSTLNPRNMGHGFFVYGSLPITLTRLASDVFQTPDLPPYKIGRALATLFDLGSVLMIFLIGRLLAGRRVALLAALFAACTVMMIQQAHFMTVDAFSTFFVLLTLFWIVRIAQGGGLPDFAAMGVSVGLAMAGGRVTMATLGVIGGVAALQAAFAEAGRRRPALVGDDPTGSSFPDEPAADGFGWLSRGISHFLSDKMPLLVLAGVLAFFSFRTFQPDAFVGSRADSPPIPNAVPRPTSLADRIFAGKGYFDIRPDPRFIENLQTIAGQASGEFDWPPSVQWARRTNYLFPLENMLWWGMGLPLGIAAWAGYLLVGWQLLRRRWLLALPLWIWVSFYFAWQGAQFAKTMRYMLPIYGPLILFAAWALVALWDRTRREARGKRQEGGVQHPSLLTRYSSLVTRHSSLVTLTRWLLLIVAVGTFCWAYAFTRIYTRDHTRLTASRWLLDNAAPGSYIASEVWDYPLPVHADGRDPWRIFKGIDTAPYAEDDLSKYTGSLGQDGKYNPGLLDQFDQADYIVLSSNRVYDSIIRLPMRYPVTIRYYHHLFNGDLGFELAADVTSYPTFLGVPIPDQGAEEAFSVYDHPRVLIFRKTANYSRAKAEQLLTGDMNWAEVYKLPTFKGGKAPTALRFTPSEWPIYQNGGTWNAIFSPITSQLPLLVWLLVLYLLGLAAFALLFHLLPMLPDRGWTLARALALLLVAYSAWLLGSVGVDGGVPLEAGIIKEGGGPLVPFGPFSVWLVATPLLVAGAFVAWQSRAELRAFWVERRRALISAEAVFLVAFGLLLLIRVLNPDLWHPDRGGEKPMDLAYLTATVKSVAFPPYDPWFAGGFINYYYFGFVLLGTLINLTGIAPNIAYNLAVPTLCGLTALGCFGVGYNLLAPHWRLQIADCRLGEKKASLDNLQSAISNLQFYERRAIASGILAALFVLLLGNLAQAIWYLPGTATVPGPGEPTPPALSSYAAQQALKGRDEWAFWDATRIIDGTVNEFPFFTFLFADLHAHMIVMPLSLAVLGLGVALARGERREVRGERGPNAREYRPLLLASNLWPLTSVLLLALTTGALRATNTWDYPTFTALMVATFGLVAWQQVRRGAPWPRTLGLTVAQVAAVLLLGNLLFWPFTSHFVTESSGAALWRDARTTLWDWVRINGLWLFLLVSAGAVLARRYGRLPWAVVAGVLGALVACLLVGLVGGYSSPVLLMPLLTCGLALAWMLRRLPVRAQLPVLWGLGGLGLWTLVEFVVVKGDVGRLNTVFKFGLHAWMLFGLSAAVALPWLFERARTWNPIGGLVWRLAAGGLVGAALIYPLTATPARIADRYDRNAPWGLDGLAYMQTATRNEEGKDFPLKPDADAIAWIRQNIPGSPVMLEAHLPSYRWGGRVAINTGLPTLLGWEWHQVQQRSAVDVVSIVENRKIAIRQAYSTPDPAIASKIFRDYGIEYVYVGGLERALYDPTGFAKFDALVAQNVLERVYDGAGTQIYKVTAPFSNGILTSDMAIIKPAKRTVPPLMLPKPVAELPQVNEYAWNSWLGQSSWGSFLLWLLIWYGLLALGLPLATLVFGGWRDGGYAWGRLLGIMLLGYAVWLPTSLGLWRYNLWGMAGGLVGVLALNIAILVWRDRDRRPKTVDRGPADESDLEGEKTRDAGAQQLKPTITSVHGPRSAVARGFSLLMAHLRPCWRPILLAEGLFLAGFGLMAAIRALNPDLWHPYFGGEKPMEFGFLNAILRSPVMPPLDPFFSDGRINYYYYGTYLMSLPIKITGIAPAIGFNLAIATIFALTLVGAFALVHELTRRISIGLLGALMLAVLGNLGAVMQIGSSSGLAPLVAALRSEGPAALLRIGQVVGDSWFWGPSRIVPEAINEFPYWAFIFADLHAHLIALPFTLLALALAFRLLAFRPALVRWGVWSSAAVVFATTLLLAALTLGTLAVSNAWDFPTYALVTALALLGRGWRGAGFATEGTEGRTQGLSDPVRGRSVSLVRRLVWLVQGGLLALLAAVGGMWLYAPFFDNYFALVSGVGLVQESTATSYYLVVFGLFLAIVLPTLFGAGWRLANAGWVRGRNGSLVLRSGLVGLAVLLALYAVFDPAPGLRFWLLVLLLVTVPLLLSRRIGSGTWYTLMLVAVAWVVSLGVELVYIKDHLDGGPAYRMNTIFKFGVQIWTLLALTAAASVPRLLAHLGRIGGIGARTLGSALVVAIVLLGLVFPLVGTPSRVANRFPKPPGPTLDGLAFMRSAVFQYDCVTWPGCRGAGGQATIDLAPDGAATAWLNANIKGTPIVLQSDLWFYRAYGIRMAANTGLPTVISGLHANEQHDPTETGRRSADVDTIYNSTQPDPALRLLAKYAVNYIYVGSVERALYDPLGLKKFDDMVGSYLSVVYDQPGVRIYQVNGIPRDLALPPVVTFNEDIQPPPGAAAPPAPPVQPAQPAQAAPDLQALEAAVAANPSQGSSAFGLAMAYRGMGRLEDAARVLAVAAPANPNDIALHHVWGDILGELGRYDEAEAAYGAAIAADPSAGNINKLGSAQLSWGRLDAARENLSKAVLTDPNASDPHYFLGLLALKENNPEGARTEFNRYLELDPNGRWSDDTRAQLEAIGAR